MPNFRLLFIFLALSRTSLADENSEATPEKPRQTIHDLEISKDQCYIYSRAAAHAVIKSIKIADSFDAFGDYRDLVMMDDVEDESNKVTIVQTAVCNNLCDQNDKNKHQFCKELMMSLEMDDMAKVGLFKTVIKKKESYVKPALAYAKVMVKKMLEKAEDIGEEHWPSIDAELKEFVEKNLDLSKAGSGIQKILNKMGVKVDVESIIQDDPKKLLKAGMNIYTVVKEKYKNYQASKGEIGGSDQKMNLDLGSLLPEAQKILGQLMSPGKDGQPAIFDEPEEGVKWLGDDDVDYEDYEMPMDELKDEL